MDKKYHTLSQVCKITGVSRRAIQGYENAGLVSACGKQQNGYLLYDQSAISRIALVKLMQELKFSLLQIARLMSCSRRQLEQEIHTRIALLRQQEGAYLQFLEKADQCTRLLCDGQNSDMVIRMITQLKNSKI